MSPCGKRLKEERFTSLELVVMPKLLWLNLDKIKVSDPFWKNQSSCG